MITYGKLSREVELTTQNTRAWFRTMIMLIVVRPGIKYQIKILFNRTNDFFFYYS
jgi:hypothetical protein